jgi:hypothetical protein
MMEVDCFRVVFHMILVQIRSGTYQAHNILPCRCQKKSQVLQIAIVFIFLSNSSTMTTSTPQYCHSAWMPPKSDDDRLDTFSKLSKNKTTHVSIGQALILVALSTAFAAVVTALTFSYFSDSLPNIHSDQLVAPGTRRVISRTTHLRHAGYVRSTDPRHAGHVVDVYDEIVDVIVEDSSSAEAPWSEVLSVGIKSLLKDNEETVRGELVRPAEDVIVEDSSSAEAPWSEVLSVSIDIIDNEKTVRGELVFRPAEDVIVEDSLSAEAPRSEVLSVGIKSVEKGNEESVLGELVIPTEEEL